MIVLVLASLAVAQEAPPPAPVPSAKPAQQRWEYAVVKVENVALRGVSIQLALELPGGEPIVESATNTPWVMDEETHEPRKWDTMADAFSWLGGQGWHVSIFLLSGQYLLERPL